MPQKIPIEDLISLRKIIRPGILLLLISHMGELPNSHQLAKMLTMDYRTVRRYLNDLIGLGYIVHQPYRNVYLLADTLTDSHKRVLKYYGWSRSTGT
jgi:Mn-dependent DtxR family transcriptional regulator